jgi:rhodanese-related sulfurtransferase
MKKPFALPFIVTTALLAATAFGQTAEGSKKADAAKTEAAATSKAHVLSVAELDKLLEQPSKLLFIDVRRPDEVSTIGGFPVYLSIQLKELEKSLAWIPKDRVLVTVSNHAGRAGKAADLLASKGFKVAGAVGADTYEKAGGKQVVHIAVPAVTNGATNGDASSATATAKK